MLPIKPKITYLIACNKIIDVQEEDGNIYTHVVEPTVFMKFSSLPAQRSFSIAIGVTVFKSDKYELKIEFITPSKGDRIELRGALHFPEFKRQGASLISLAVDDYEFRVEGEYTINAYINEELLYEQHFNVYTVGENENV